jgi:hypothetical protein
MANQGQNEYYQTIAREFLRRRGAPFFLSPRDLTIIAGWESQKIPLQVVLEGIGQAFDGIRNRSRGTKGLALSFCDPRVQKALAQDTDRRVGLTKTVSPRSEKVGRALKESERFLGSLAAGDRGLRALFETASRFLSQASPDEEALGKIDDDVDEFLWRLACQADRDRLKREVSGEFSGRTRGEIEAAARTRLVKAARQKDKIPYASLFYY